MSHKYSASIVGSRGYSGLELARLLLAHKAIQLTHAFATKAFRLSDDLLAAGADAVICLPEDQLMHNLTDIVFLATPAEVSLELAPKILAAGKKVIDLSGAFRLTAEETQKWYGLTHSVAVDLNEAEYGLVPFVGPARPGTRLISNPGCYATAIAMALIPLLKHDLIETNGLVIDAKSGSTGAGRKAVETSLFSEVDGECLPYRVGRHQHLPEIQKSVFKYSGQNIDPHFVTHLLPIKRGISAGIYATAKTLDLEAIAKAYDQEFADYPLVRHGQDVAKLAKLSHVVSTPYTNISYTLVGSKLYVFSTIDNLMKGAASQAVENLNRLLDLTPMEGA